MRFRIVLRRMRNSFQPPVTTLRPKFPLYSGPHDSVTKSGVGKVAGADITRELHNTQVAHARQLMGLTRYERFKD